MKVPVFPIIAVAAALFACKTAAADDPCPCPKPCAPPPCAPPPCAPPPPPCVAKTIPARCETVTKTVECPAVTCERCVPVYETVKIPVYETNCTRQVPITQSVCDPCTGATRVVECGCRTETYQSGCHAESRLCGYDTETFQCGSRCETYQSGVTTEKRFARWRYDQVQCGTRS